MASWWPNARLRQAALSSPELRERHEPAGDRRAGASGVQPSPSNSSDWPLNFSGIWDDLVGSLSVTQPLTLNSHTCYVIELLILGLVTC